MNQYVRLFRKALEYWNIGTLEKSGLGKRHSITPSLQYSTIPVFISPSAAHRESPTSGVAWVLRPAPGSNGHRVPGSCRSCAAGRSKCRGSAPAPGLAPRPDRRGGIESSAGEAQQPRTPDKLRSNTIPDRHEKRVRRRSTYARRRNRQCDQPIPARSQPAGIPGE